MADPTNEEKLIQVGEKYRAERTVFTKFINAILKVKQKYPSFAPSFKKVHEAVFDGEELDFTFAGRQFSLTFNFSILDGKNGSNGSTIGLIVDEDDGSKRYAVTIVIDQAGGVTNIPDKSFKLPDNAEHLFCSMLVSQFTPMIPDSTGLPLPTFKP